VAGDDLGDRMKSYEMAEAGRRFLPRLPICVRVDGRSFSRWTRSLRRPFDERFSAAMIETARTLLDESGARVAYVQSDEISLVLLSEDPKQSVFFDGRVQKLTSVLASLAAARFAAAVRALLPERADDLAAFDCRAWVVPSRDEAVNALLWREHDALKNSLSMAARAHHPPAALMNKRGPELHELLHQAGVNWNDFPAHFKRGTYLQRRTFRRRFTETELAQLPERHEARRDPDLEVERSEIVALDLPPLSQVVNRVDVLLDGAEPVTG
jgi:tRNA(His) guanylyltransferase